MPASPSTRNLRARSESRTARRRQFLGEAFGRMPGWHRTTRLWGEMLEPRLMMAVDTPDIVVGRTLSAYSVNDVQNGELRVTYTVYNQEAEDVSGVLLTSTLQPGVSFTTASQLPDQNGQELAWSLGTIPAYGRASVELTVQLADNSVLTIDDGVEAFSTLNARSSSDAAPAAVLKGTPLSAALLASTIDANTADPFIQEQAARLDYDPQRIIDFLQDDVGYESYVGSLRGARGTLWSAAGNALDEASLGVALFRASGIPAQYAAGTLSDPLAQQLILSMFPDDFQSIGIIPAGTPVSDPANDSQLLAETKNHHWIQFDAGLGLTDIDTTIAGATTGQSFAAATSTFAEVPDALRHHLKIRLNVEEYSQASAAFGLGSGLSEHVALEQEFSSAELYGRTLTIGHLISETSIPSPIFTSRTVTYSPYLIIGDAGSNFSTDPIIPGTDFQEVMTNFPFGTKLLTGLFLEMEQSAPTGGVGNFEKTLVDRIGYAARHNGAGSGSVDPNGPPALSPFDLVTVSAISGKRPPTAPATAESGANALSRFSEFAGRFSTLTPGRRGAEVVEGLELVRELLSNVLRSRIADFEAQSSFNNDLNASALKVKGYLATPRLTVALTKLAKADTDAPEIVVSLDLLSSTHRVVVAPGQAITAGYAFNVNRGLLETAIEASVMSVASGNGEAVTAPVGTAAIFDAAARDNIPVITLQADNLGGSLLPEHSPEVRARVTQALLDGKDVLIPESPVHIRGESRAAWYEIDRVTGETVSVLDDGSHGILDFTFIYLNEAAIAAETSSGALFLAGFIAGFFEGTVFRFAMLVLLNQFNGLYGNETTQGLSNVKSYAHALIDIGKEFIKYRHPAFLAGYALGKLAVASITADPPLADGTATPFTGLPNHAVLENRTLPANTQAGTIAGSHQATHATIAGDLRVQWSSSASNVYTLITLVADGVVKNQLGEVVRTGPLSIETSRPVAATVTGILAHNLNGQGALDAYSSATSWLGLSAEWDSYSAELTGVMNLVLVVTSGLTLNGIALAPGRYTIETSQARLTGNGATSGSASFSTSVSIDSDAALLRIGPGTNNLTVNGTGGLANTGVSFSGFSGSIDITAAGAVDNYLLSGSATQVLQVVSDASVPGNQNSWSPIAVQLNSSLAGQYALQALAPTGWSVRLDAAGASVKPPPGVGPGDYPIRIVAASPADAGLIAASDVIVSVTATAPGVALAVSADSAFTVPFNGAQVPTSFRATMQNLGPAADTYDLTFPNPPVGFNILRSANSLTVPAGETGITGVYLEPNGVLPAPGTSISFTVTATSRTNPLITQTETFTFEMPAVAAVTVDANPVKVSTTPGAPVTGNVVIRNVGNVPYNLAIGASLPNGLTVSGLTTPVALAVGQTTTQTVTFTPAAGTPLNSTLTPTFTYGPAVAANQAAVVQVSASDSHVEVGQTLTVSADVFAAVLQAQQGSVALVVKNSLGAVVQSAAATPFALGVVAATTTVSLGSVDTTGLAPGEYTIEVTVRDAGNVVLPGAVGIGKFFVGLPISATQDVTPNTVSEGLELAYVTGNTTVESSVQVGQQPLVSLLDTNGTAINIALSGNLAYVAGTKEVTIVDLSNPASPQIVGSFGADQLSQDAFNVAQIVGSNLVIGSTSTVNSEVTNIIVFSLANPLSPQFVSTTSVPYRFISDLLVQGTTAVVPTSGISFTLPGTIVNQFGDVVALNLAATPAVADVLFNTNGSPNGGNTRQSGGTIVNSGLAYIGSSTFTGNNTTTGNGRVLGVNIADPANLSVVADVAIPGMKQVLDIAIDGNRALVVGSTGSVRNPFNGFNDLGLEGTLALSVLDITNPNSPVVIGTTKVTEATFPSGTSPSLLQAVSLGNGQFAVSGVKIPQRGPAIVVVDATNAVDIQTRNLSTPALVNGLSVSGPFLHASSAAGLATYRISAIVPTAVHVEVQIPNGTGVAVDASSFNVAPTQTIVGPGFNTLVWELTLSASQPTQELTWNANITGMIPGTTKSVTLGATINATSAGSATDLSLPGQVVAATPATQTLQIPVRVAVPGADAIARGAVTATRTGRTDLGNRMNDLSTSLTNLVINPADDIARSQSLATLTAIRVLLDSECCLQDLNDELVAAQNTLAAASGPIQIQGAVIDVGDVIDQIAARLDDLLRHEYRLDLVFNQFIVQPDVPARFDVFLQNIGTQATTYDFVLEGLPDTATSVFNQTSITLAPGEFIGASGATQEVYFTIAQSGLSLAAFGFTLSAIPREAPLLVCPTDGSLALRNEFIGVASVLLGTNFTQPGPIVPVTANLISTVNSPTNVEVFYEVRNSSGQVVFTSASVPAALTVAAPLVSVVLPVFDTTGAAEDTYSVVTLVKDDLGVLIPGATASTTLLIGTPLSATLTVADRGGLNAEFFDFTTALSVMPNFTGLTPDIVQLANTVNYPNTGGAFAGLDSRFIDTFASRHSGFIKITNAGTYTFYLSSDDGSRLFIDGVQVINHDGIHGQSERSAAVPLTAGYHDVRIEYFENSGNSALVFSWEGPGIVKQVVPESVLYPQQTVLGSSVTLQPGTRIVNNELTIESQTAFTDPLTFRGIVDTPGLANSVVTYGNVAYVSGSNDISIVDITNPDSPSVVGSFAGSLIVQNGFNISRIVGDRLIVGTSVPLNANGFNVLIYDLTNPLSPALISNTAIAYRFLTDFLVQGTTVLATLNGYTFFTSSGSIFDQFGDVVSLDISNPAAPTVADVLFNNRGMPNGGDFRNLGGTFVNNTTSYIASTTSVGGGTATGSGRILIVDSTNPANLTLAQALLIPGTVNLVDIAVQGNRALVVGSTAGTQNPINGTNDGFTGNLSLTLLDTTNPLNPTIIGSTLVTSATFPRGAIVAKLDAVSLGNGLFAVSEAVVNGQPVLLLVDPSDEDNLIVSFSPMPALQNGIEVVGDKLYTTSSAGLAIFDIGQLESIPLTASVKIPNGTGVSIVPGSFNIPPSAIIPGPDFDTLVWNRNLAFGNDQFNFTWQSTVTNLAPGEVRDVTLGAQIESQVGNAGSAEPLNFTGWTTVNLLDPGQGNGNWVLSNGNTTATQTVNGVPTMLLSNFSATAEQFEGNFRVNTSDDDDFIGFIFGYQDSQHFYVFDWKQTDQSTAAGFGERGMSVKVISADTPVNASDMWPTAGNGTRAQTLYHNTTTYADFTDYRFQLQFTPGTFTITITQGANVVESFTVNDSTYSAGKFGFYNYSQANVIYSGFTREELVIPFSVTLPETTARALPAARIALGLTPPAQTLQPGGTTDFVVTVSNPNATAGSFSLSTVGIPEEWVSLPASVQVAANGSVQVPLQITTDIFAQLGDQGFTVVATNGTQQGFVQGTLTFVGPALTVDPESHGIVTSIVPNLVTTGQGQPGAFTVRLTNTGSATDTFNLMAALPPGFTAAFEQTSVEIPPGVSNFREITALVTPPAGTIAAVYPFTVTATSAALAEIASAAIANLSVVVAGVDVSLSPSAAPAGTTFQLTVRNTGSTTDTFDLALAGPAALVSTLTQSSVTLAPGALQVINVNVAAIDFAVAGSLELAATATSRNNNAVKDQAAADITIPLTFAMESDFEEDTITLAAPGTGTFLLLVDNLGNGEDAYEATIIATSGPLTATLIGLDGSAVQTVPVFRLPGLSNGAIVLNANLADVGSGTITVQVRSLTNDTIVSQSVATLRSTITDFGDAPDTYGTTLASDGARHLAIGPQLGLNRDPEIDATPTTNALGDDTTGDVDDEDGVILPGLFVAGTCDCSGTGLGNQIIVNATGPGFLDAWIDFNRNGKFDPNEQIAASFPIQAGANTLVPTIPTTVNPGPSFARFRLSSTGGLGPTGAANDGEVEDHAVQLFNPQFGSAGIIADPLSVNGRVLYIKGTESVDAIVVRQTSPTMVTVYIAPTLSIGSFALNSFDRIVICGLGAPDAIAVEAPIFKPTVIYGDEGNDSISGGSGPDIIFGGDGYDAIAGNAGDDTISGGNSSDSLVGGLGFDTFIGSGSGSVSLSNTQFRSGNHFQALGFFELATITGGAASDTFDLTGWSFPATVDGGGGVNTIVDGGDANYTLSETALTRVSASGTRTIGLTNIRNASLSGGFGNNSFNLTAWPHPAALRGEFGTDTFSVAGDAAYTLTDTMLLRPGLGLIRLDGLEHANLTGGEGDNVFNILSWTKTATINGADGSDKLISSGNMNFTLTNTSLTRSTGGAIALASIEEAELTGGAGNNTLNATGFSGSVKLDGGAGSDTLQSGPGLALLLGGLGNDILTAGSGRAVMIGGAGLDRLTGGASDDLLISGQTAHDANVAALAAILAEWTSANSYADRVAHLTGTTGGLNNGKNLHGANVTHDTAVDILFGGLGNDLFFAKLTSPAADSTDKGPTETAL